MSIVLAIIGTVFIGSIIVWAIVTVRQIIKDRPVHREKKRLDKMNIPESNPRWTKHTHACIDANHAVCAANYRLVDINIKLMVVFLIIMGALAVVRVAVGTGE